MVNHTQTITQQQSTSVVDHFVGLALKRLRIIGKNNNQNLQKSYEFYCTGHLFSVYAKFSEKLTFFKRVRNNRKMTKNLRTY